MRLRISCCVLVVLAIHVQLCTSARVVWGEPVCVDEKMEFFEYRAFSWHLYRSQCYVFIYHRLQYQDAQKYCMDRNASVVELNEERENKYVSEYALFMPPFMKKEINETWIGINRNSQQEWVYNTSGTALTYTKWAYNEPSDSAGDCAVFRKTDQWFAEDCSESRTFICEKRWGYRY